MSKPIRKVPELRFKGFTDDWEQRKWLDTVDISNNMVDPKSGNYDKLPHVGPGNIESFTGRLLNNVRTVKEDKLISGKFHFHKGDIIYGKINPQLGKYIYSPYEGLASADAYVLTTKNGLDRNFLFVLLQTNHFYQYSVSVSMRSGMPKINRNELNMYSFTAPLEVEQEKIGLFFFKLDAMITLHQRKLAALNRLKEVYLLNMFSQNEDNLPKLRFANFNGNWELRKLRNLVSLENGYAFKSEYFSDDYKETIVLTPGSVKIGGGYQDGKGRYYNAKKNYPDKYIFSSGDIFVTMTDLTPSAQSLGYPAIVPEDGNIYLHNQRLGKLENFSGNKYFLFHLLCTEDYHKKIISTASGTTVKHSSSKKILDYTTSFPADDEQTKIGSFFNQLDHLITLQQQKLTQLQKLKKAYLQKMFF